MKVETEYNRLWYGGHDSAAVLLRNGEIVAAIEEERLSRVKHCNFFPKRAIDFCLRQGGIGLNEVDIVAVNCSQYDAHIRALNDSYQDCSIEVKSGAELLSANFEIFYQQSISNKLFYCNHHMAHAWNAFALSGFEESLVVVLDGDGPSGDGRSLSGVIGVAENGKFNLSREIDAQDSLGNFYSDIIKLIGYDRFDEYKVMGLAPYGDPAKFRNFFRSLYSLEQDGGFQISENPVFKLWDDLNKLESFQSPRRKGGAIEQVHKDFAAAVQETLEDIALHVIRAAHKDLKQDYLCLDGGVAHNCTLNGKIEKIGLFKNFFVQPTAHDAGGALGAALYAQSINNGHRSCKLDHLYYGTPIPQSDQIADELFNWEPAIKFVKSENICREAANIIADNAVVGWVQGRSEFGPRALGNRSILADPRPAENKSRINKMIKKREGYRPFAPSVIAEQADEFFDINQDSKNLSFMNLITSVRKEKRDSLGAITHVDGTARIQVVKQETNPKYWGLISEFNEITGIPILLNTSFNNNVEPIVDSATDAIVCFLTTELTHLVIDNYIIYKNEPVNNCFPDYYISIKESSKLVSGFKTVSGGFARTYTIEFNLSRYFARVSTEISEDLFRIINCADNQKIADAARYLDINLDEELMDEIFTLWSERVIRLSPVG